MHMMCSRQQLMDEGHVFTLNGLQLPVRASLMNSKNSIDAYREFDFIPPRYRGNPMQRRRILTLAGLALLAGAAIPAAAQDTSAAVPSQPLAAPRQYAVMSLMGDTLNVVTYRPQVGSRLDRNEHAAIPMPAGLLDNAVLRAVDRGIQHAAQPQKAAPIFLAAASELVQSTPDKLFDGPRLVLPDEVVAGMRGTAATHLILVTRYRAPANLRALRTRVGTGYLEGPGFYVDQVLPMTIPETGETGKGFLAPFLYLKFSLIDLATLNSLQTQTVTASGTFSVARNKGSVDPWQALSPAEKLEVIQHMIADEVKRVVPKLLAGA